MQCIVLPYNGLFSKEFNFQEHSFYENLTLHI